MELTLSNIATEMSNEATKFLEENADVSENSIVKLPTCGNDHRDLVMYACQYDAFIIVACIEEERVSEVKIVG